MRFEGLWFRVYGFTCFHDILSFMTLFIILSILMSIATCRTERWSDGRMDCLIDGWMDG